VPGAGHPDLMAEPALRASIGAPTALSEPPPLLQHTDALYDPSGQDGRHDHEPDSHAEGINDLNPHTSGQEFYGKMGIFSFLARLRQRASSHQQPQHTHRRSSLVRYLHNTEYSTPFSPSVSSHSPHREDLQTLNTTTPGPHAALQMSPDRSLELICIRVYFTTLHLIHPVLDEKSFMHRCQSDMWNGFPAAEADVNRSFRAIYYVVLALGAIVSTTEAFGTLLHRAPGPANTIPSSTDNQEATPQRPTGSPRELAKIFFEHAKKSLGDVFEVSSLESVQALFLLSVFCQNALRPHSCYLFNCMAANHAIAIGLPYEKYGRSSIAGERFHTATRTFWCIYAHEVEMNCASGRDMLMRPSSHYQLPLPPTSPNADFLSDHGDSFVATMVLLADILRQASEELYQSTATPTIRQAEIAKRLDDSLTLWKDTLPNALQFGRESLSEPESISRQKVVLELRYYSARMLLRPYFS